jgi:class 3 adenylate cyclase/CHASE2 domain-containing sensor protein
VQLKSVKPTAILIAAGVVLAVVLLALARLEFFERLERMTYDQRVRVSRHFPAPVATNLGFVFISDESIAAVNDGLLGKHYGLYWPRHIYGRLLRELNAQQARSVAFDILLPQERLDHGGLSVPVKLFPDLTPFLERVRAGQPPEAFQETNEVWTRVESDEFLAWQLARSGIAILAAERDVRPHPLFATNASAYADISADADPDGVLRRARVFQEYPRWHPAVLHAATKGYRTRIEPGRLVAEREGEEDLIIPLDANTNLDLADFYGGPSRLAPAYTLERVWHMGVQLAARELGLDLERARVDLSGGQITLTGSNGVNRVIPVDAAGYMLIDWEMSVQHPALTIESIENLLLQDRARLEGHTTSLTNRWRDKLVVVGSSALGNDLTDHGATPLEKDTLLVSKHWNVASSIVTGRFVRRASFPIELLFILVLGVITALLTWRVRAFTAFGGVFFLALLYIGLGFWLFVRDRYWLPLVVPVGGAMLAQYVLLATYRVVFEERERRRTRSIFSKLVAPEIVNEVLKLKDVTRGGERRTLTVLFADVRGFTELTDKAEEHAAQTVRARNLTGAEAEECHHAMARETLGAVNLYLSTVSTLVKQHRGVLDKYIGDCVMAFWGAPVANPRHATACVRMAIAAQRAIFELNRQREQENQAIEIENRTRASAGSPSRSPLALLMLGTGINTGSVTVGLMGSDEHGLNYTVFGREVNLASRLESVSGRGRIVIGENTLLELQRDDPKLAALCIELESVTPKGFQKPVRIFEVPWQNNSPGEAGGRM